MAAEKSEYIKKAYEDLNRISADEEKRLEYEERERAIRDHQYFSTVYKKHRSKKRDDVKADKKVDKKAYRLLWSCFRKWNWKKK